MKIFFDTNVLVSAYVARGLCSDLLRLVQTQHRLLVGEVVLAEFRRVLAEKLRVPRDVAAAVERNLRMEMLVARPPRPWDRDLDDADDAWVVASAVLGGADMLVTGDAGLLAGARDAPVPVLSPREAWERLQPRAGPPSR